MEELKKCIGCGEEKGLDCFGMASRFRLHTCKECVQKEALAKKEKTTSKRCTVCLEEKLLSEFHLSLGRPVAICKPCISAKKAARKACDTCGVVKLKEEFFYSGSSKNRTTCKECLGTKLIDGKKKCTLCNEIKLISEFSFRDKAKGTTRHECKACLYERGYEHVHHICDVCSVDKPAEDFLNAKAENKTTCRDCLGITVIDGKRKCQGECGLILQESEFYSFDSKDCLQCKTCYNKNAKELREPKKKEINQKERLRYLENREKESIRKKEFRINNKEMLSQRQKDRFKNDPQHKIYRYFGNYIRKTLKKNGESYLKHLDHTIDEYKTHIESTFEPWMTWDNWGVYDPKTWDDNDSSTWTWHIDHIRESSKFKYISMNDQEFKDCWHPLNLRAYSAKQNIIDGNRRPDMDKESK